MNAFAGFLHEVPGKVEKIISANEAEISFKWNKTQQFGILPKQNLLVDCQPATAKYISDYLHFGSKIKFSCTNPGSATTTNPLRIVKAWRMESTDTGFPQFGFPNTVRPGLTNVYLTVAEVSKKLAVLVYKNEDGKEEFVLMLASKLYIGKKRVNANLTSAMRENEGFYCDAIPVIPSTNEKNCGWFATCVWRGNKPAYDKRKKNPVNFQEESDELAHNPYNLFLFAEGLIMDNLNHENGLILGEIKPKVFETVIFNRSVCYMGNTSFANTDLNSIFRERDRVRFMAVRVPPTSKLVVKWVATYVAPLDPADNADFLEHGMKVQ